MPLQAIDELSMADSFIMGVLRGWRLLQAAALQNLWDDQLLGQRYPHSSGYSANYVSAADDHDLYYQDSGDWWSPGEDWWYDGYYQDQDWTDTSWWDDDWSGLSAQDSFPAVKEPEDPADEAKLKEAQQAERVAESLAQRTWTEARRATQALRKVRGFGSAAMSSLSSGGKCFLCGGSHLARDCPDRRHPGFFKGHNKGKYGYLLDQDYENNAYFTGKGKGKFKGKKGYWLDSQALKGKSSGKSKGKSMLKDSGRSVNAYASDLFAGGLELSEAMDLNSAHALPNNPQKGMLDCGATASAAPEAVVQNLISTVLSHDPGARIELDQSARPYFRFGNGKWGRALCRVHLHSKVSGSPRHFALCTLPNPIEFYQNGLDQASLVPVLVGMDFLGPSGVGMMIDFGAGLAMHTNDSNDSTPVIYQLEANQKGHRVLDIVYHLTQGHRSNEGQAHVIVRDLSPQEDTSNQAHQLLELGTMYIDMAASDHAPSEHALAVTRDRVWQLYQHGHPGAPPAASTAQMGASSFNLQSTPSSSRSFGHGSAVLAAADLPQPGRRADPHCSRKGQGVAQEEVQIAGPNKEDSRGSSRSTIAADSVAMLRQAHPGTGSEQCPRKLDHVQLPQPEAPLHPSKGITFEQHSGGQSSDGGPDACGASIPAGQHQAHGQGMPPHDEQDHGRGSSPRFRQRTQVLADPRLPSFQDETDLNDIEPTADDMGRGGPGRGAGGRLRGGSRTTMRSTGFHQLPLYMAKKVMAMATLMTAMTATLLSELQLDGRDGLWEVACSPHSWLSSAAEEHGIQPFRVNLAAGFDLMTPRCGTDYVISGEFVDPNGFGFLFHALSGALGPVSTLIRPKGRSSSRPLVDVNAVCYGISTSS